MVEYDIKITSFPVTGKLTTYVDLRKLLFFEGKTVVFNCDDSQMPDEFKIWLWNNIKAKNNIYWFLRELVDCLRFKEALQINYYNLQPQFASILKSCLIWMMSFEPESIDFIHQDILEITKGLVAQQVNTKRRMGRGLAHEIRRRFPNVYFEYMGKQWQLADVQLVKIGENLFICNIAGQDDYGNDKRYTDYSALAQGLEKLNAIAQTMELKVYFPWRFGSGNAGGSTWYEKIETWDSVLEIVADKIPDAIICKK